MNVIKEFRLKKGLTQVQVSQIANMTVRNYQYIEAGERIPSVHTAILIAKALGVKNVEKLFPINT